VSTGAIDRALYFAYGSNLSSSHLRGRVASARTRSSAWLAGHRVSFGKQGRDGSGKATLVIDSGARVWGALYSIDPVDWQTLDRFEPGYDRVAVTVTTSSEERLAATTYLAPETAPEPIALAAYKRLMIAGAREHALPGAYIDSLLRLPEYPERLR
jgi:gamma-glutamylcyclotransferase (GGCT)/AIG2-like uncharacterized protein YtfP